VAPPTRHPLRDSKINDVADISLADLPDEVISSILGAVAASAVYPDDFISPTMT
jgi:hypothetical protein